MNKSLDKYIRCIFQAFWDEMVTTLNSDKLSRLRRYPTTYLIKHAFHKSHKRYQISFHGRVGRKYFLDSIRCTGVQSVIKPLDPLLLSFKLRFQTTFAPLTEIVILLLDSDSFGIWYVGNMCNTDLQRMVQKTIDNRDSISSRIADLQDNVANG